MKKKGLIISTVVMAVVLIASLTTATYAWFSTSASAKIDQINLNVEAASSMVIGVNKVAITDLTSTDAKTPTSYVNGTGLTYNLTNNVWTGENEGLGTELGLGLNFSIGAGVGSGTAGTSYSPAEDITSYLDVSDPAHIVWDEDSDYATDLFVYSGDGVFAAVSEAYSAATTYYVANTSSTHMDYTYYSDHELYKASGTSYETLASFYPAIINGQKPTGSTETNVIEGSTDVLDLIIGTRIAKADQYGSYCKITITPTSSYMGMATALWLEVKVGDNVYGGDIFDLLTGDDDDVHYNDTAEAYTFWFWIDALNAGDISGKYSVKPTVVNPISIKAFVSGYDEDCINSATGTGATIDLEFNTVASNAAPTESAGWHLLQAVSLPTAPIGG